MCGIYNTHHTMSIINEKVMIEIDVGWVDLTCARNGAVIKADTWGKQ